MWRLKRLMPRRFATLVPRAMKAEAKLRDLVSRARA
jgi:hypothetical protein